MGAFRGTKRFVVTFLLCANDTSCYNPAAFHHLWTTWLVLANLSCFEWASRLMWKQHRMLVIVLPFHKERMMIVEDHSNYLNHLGATFQKNRQLAWTHTWEWLLNGEYSYLQGIAQARQTIIVHMLLCNYCLSGYMMTQLDRHVSLQTENKTVHNHIQRGAALLFTAALLFLISSREVQHLWVWRSIAEANPSLTHTHTPKHTQPCISIFVRTFIDIMHYPAPNPEHPK